MVVVVIVVSQRNINHCRNKMILVLGAKDVPLRPIDVVIRRCACHPSHVSNLGWDPKHSITWCVCAHVNLKEARTLPERWKILWQIQITPCLRIKPQYLHPILISDLNKNKKCLTKKMRKHTFKCFKFSLKKRQITFRVFKMQKTCNFLNFLKESNNFSFLAIFSLKKCFFVNIKKI